MPLNVSFGATACGLAAGDMKHPNSTPADGGPAQWPVFCVVGDTTTEGKLTGRFGDPLWGFLAISLHR